LRFDGDQYFITFWWPLCLQTISIMSNLSSSPLVFRLFAAMRKFLIVGFLAQSFLAIAQTAPVSSAPVLQALKGLYVEQRAVGANFAYAHYYFWSDGRYCLGLPSGGLDGDQADFSKLKLTQPCGQYRLANDQNFK
jgi:hypothetical protein